MKKLIHFGPPLKNHYHAISIETKGSFLATMCASAQLILAAALLPLAWLLKTRINIGIKDAETLGQKFMRSKNKAKFAKDWNENLLRMMDSDEFPYLECDGCGAFQGQTCTGVKFWIQCGYLRRGATLKEKP